MDCDIFVSSTGVMDTDPSVNIFGIERPGIAEERIAGLCGTGVFDRRLCCSSGCEGIRENGIADRGASANRVLSGDCLYLLLVAVVGASCRPTELRQNVSGIPILLEYF